MNSARDLVLGAVVSVALALTACGTTGGSAGTGRQPVPPETSVYMPPEVPLESIRIQGDPRTAGGGGPDWAFSLAAARVAARYGDRFLAEGAAAKGRSGYWIVLTDRPDHWAISVLAQLPVDVEVKYGAPATRSQLDDIEAALVSVLEAYEDEFFAVTAAPSRFATSIVVRYGLVALGANDDASGHQDSFDDALTAAAARSSGGTLALPVRFVHDQSLDRPTV